jgi:hypothetical protein
MKNVSLSEQLEDHLITREISKLLEEARRDELNALAQLSTMASEVIRYKTALEESVKLQNHYAGLLNMSDGGQRMQFPSTDSWIERLESLGKIRKIAF